VTDATNEYPDTSASPLELGSPEWWLQRLSRKMDLRDRGLCVLDDYYTGQHPMMFATDPFRKAFGSLLDPLADNWCDLVVDAVEERLNVQGFRLNADATKGDTAAWEIWQRNQLDAESQIGHTESLIHGEASALVWWNADGSGPQITVEHPRTMIVDVVPGHRLQRRAALKRFKDDDGFVHAVLFLPAGIWKFKSREKYAEDADVSRINWEPEEFNNEAWPLPNKLGVVPVVPLWNRPRSLKLARSEIATVIPIQNAINKLCADMIVASEFAAFRQRWATGIEIPKDPETDQPIAEFKASVERFWLFDTSGLSKDDQQPQFGEFAASDLTNYVKPIELLVQHVASQTRTPPHYFYLSGQFPSGESIKSAETGLVAKSRRKMRMYGEAWEEIMRLAGQVAGNEELANATSAETIWGDPESRSESEHIDALLKQKTFGIPDEILWEKAGYSPTEIERIKKLRAEEAAATAALAPAPIQIVPALPAAAS
jgi:hypothetical protein